MPRPPEERRKPRAWWTSKKWLCGMRPGAWAWEEGFTEKLETLGIHRGKAAPTCFWDEGPRARALVHGDDFVAVGPKEGVNRVRRNMKKWPRIEVRALLGRDADDDRDAAVLGRTACWGTAGRPAARQADQGGHGIEPGSNGVVSPVVREDMGEREVEEKVSRSEASRYRAVAARSIHLGVHRSPRPSVCGAGGV